MANAKNLKLKRVTKLITFCSLILSMGLSGCGKKSATSGNSGGTTYGTIQNLLGKTYSATCQEVIFPGSEGPLYVTASFSISASLPATANTEILIHLNSSCDENSRFWKMQSQGTVSEGTEGLDNLPVGAIATDTTVISSHWTYYSEEIADQVTSECAGAGGAVFTNGVATEVTGKCGEPSQGAIKYGIVKLTTSTSPAQLSPGDTEGENDGSTPQKRQSAFNPLILTEQ